MNGLPGCRCVDICLCRPGRVERLDAPRPWPTGDEADVFVPVAREVA